MNKPMVVFTSFGFLPDDISLKAIGVSKTDVFNLYNIKNRKLFMLSVIKYGIEFIELIIDVPKEYVS